MCHRENRKNFCQDAVATASSDPRAARRGGDSRSGRTATRARRRAGEHERRGSGGRSCSSHRLSLLPGRQALLDRLAEVAVTDAGAPLAAARVDEVPFDEAVTRAVRVLVDVGDYFIALARERNRPAPEEFHAKVAGPLRRLLSERRRKGQFARTFPVRG